MNWNRRNMMLFTQSLFSLFHIFFILWNRLKMCAFTKQKHFHQNHSHFHFTCSFEEKADQMRYNTHFRYSKSHEWHFEIMRRIFLSPFQDIVYVCAVQALENENENIVCIIACEKNITFRARKKSHENRTFFLLSECFRFDNLRADAHLFRVRCEHSFLHSVRV